MVFRDSVEGEGESNLKLARGVTWTVGGHVRPSMPLMILKSAAVALAMRDGSHSLRIPTGCESWYGEVRETIQYR